MGSLQELEKQLRLKDEKIRELQKVVDEKDEMIQQLISKLDKFQSVLPQTQTKLIAGPRKQRAQGISAEPQAMKTLQDMSGAKFRRYSKSERSVHVRRVLCYIHVHFSLCCALLFSVTFPFLTILCGRLRLTVSKHTNG